MNSQPSRNDAGPDFLDGDGEMTRRIRDFAWWDTAIGHPTEWPEPLKTTLRIVLALAHPACIFWGKDLICLYNDAFARSIGTAQDP